MGDKSKIEWTEATWNPTVGCTHVSPGCDNCYAASLASGRLAGTPTYAGLASGGKFTGEVRLLPDRLGQPLRWRRPRVIFVNSMSDLFHDDIPNEYIARVFAVMHDAEQHTFQILTKRHARLRSLLNSEDFYGQFVGAVAELRAAEQRYANPNVRWPLPNVWLGVSVETQQWADIRVPALLDTPAAVRFLSCEPLLGPLRLSHGLYDWDELDQSYVCRDHGWPECSQSPACNRIDWVIAGGESGARARPMHPDWARTLRDQCAAAGVPYFFKQAGEFTWQVGGGYREPDLYVSRETGQALPDHEVPAVGDWQGLWRVGKREAGRELDGRTHDEYPAAVTP